MIEYKDLLRLNLSNKKVCESSVKLLYNLANLENYLFRSEKLVSICEDIASLNKLYIRQFKKIDTYDEEEECTVQS